MTNALSVPYLTTPDAAAAAHAPARSRSAMGHASDADTMGIVRTLGELDALAAEWDDLFARAGDGCQVFQTFGWVRHWAGLFTADQPRRGHATLVIVTVHRAGRLVLVWPMCVERVAQLRQLCLAGNPVSQYGDVLAEPLPDLDAILDQAWSYVRDATRPDLVWFAKVRADAVLAPFLRRLGTTITAREEAPYADLSRTPTYADFETRLTSKARKNQRRHFRRMEERGTLTNDVASGPAAADAAHLTLVLKRAWLTERGLVSRAFADPRLPAFFRGAAAAGVGSTGVQIARLMSAGECANAMITVTAKDRRTVHMLAYGLKFERLSPGSCHLELAVRQAIEDGVATFDFLAPRHDYKMDWSDGVVAVEDHTLAISRRGRLYSRVWTGGLREAMKAIARRLPRSVGAALGRLHRRDATQA
jgi:CelD/BcsL family acetyltransferase involved in cellulose biosynthesis